MRLFFPALLLAATAVHLHAAPRFNGAVGYEWVNNMASMALSVGMVDNSASKSSTGTMQVKLWASKTPGTGAPVSGYLLASFKLDPLKPGQLYRDLRKVVPYTPPSTKGTYYLVYTLVEYTGTGSTGYTMVDYRNLQGTRTLEPLEMWSLTAPWHVQTNYAAGTVSIQIGKISHRRPGRTGTLQISAWATTSPFRGGQIQGKQIAVLTKKGLEPGSFYTDFKDTAPFMPPANGTYFITVMVSEYLSDGYHMMDYLTSPDAVTFKKP